MGSVEMRDPRSGRRQRASQQAFDERWGPEGWVLVPTEPPTEAPAPAKKTAARRPKKRATK